MISKWRYLAQHLLKQIWVQAALYSLLGIAAAFLAPFLAFLVPDGVARAIGGDAVDRLLTILATSMLAVATFSLTAMVAAYAQAATGATPRATSLLVEDRTAQTALSAFIGAFLFSVVGVVALSSGFYSSRERVILFGVTILVLVMVVVTLIRWISEVTRLGRLPNTLKRLENAATQALALRAQAPLLGCRPYGEWVGEGMPVASLRVGYIQHLDTGALQAYAERENLQLRIEVNPGSFVHRGRTISTVTGSGPLPEKIADELNQALTIGAERTFDQDPRFGLVAMSEVASRALSPAVNDPGTAIAVIGGLVRVLTRWHDEQGDIRVTRNRLHMRALSVDDMLEDGFTPIGRDGAGMAEVMVRLQKGLEAVAALGDPDLAPAARRQSNQALERARKALTSADDIARVEDAARWSHRGAAGPVE